MYLTDMNAGELADNVVRHWSVAEGRKLVSIVNGYLVAFGPPGENDTTHSPDGSPLLGSESFID